MCILLECTIHLLVLYVLGDCEVIYIYHYWCYIESVMPILTNHTPLTFHTRPEAEARYKYTRVFLPNDSLVWLFLVAI